MGAGTSVVFLGIAQVQLQNYVYSCSKVKLWAITASHEPKLRRATVSAQRSTFHRTEIR